MRRVRVGRWPSEGPSSASAILDTRNAVVMKRYTLAAPRWVPVDPGRSRRPALRLVGHGSAPSTGRFPCFGHTWPLQSVTARAGVQSRWCRGSCVVSHPPEASDRPLPPWRRPARFSWRGRRGSQMRLETDRRVAGATRPADSAFGSSRRLSAPDVNVETPSLAPAPGRRACRAAHGPV